MTTGLWDRFLAQWKKISTNLRYFIVGFLATALLVTAKVSIECTFVGTWAEREAFDFLMSTLRHLSNSSAGVVVVDINHLRDGLPEAADPPFPTPREPIKALLSQIAKLNPLAIGVDIDFSPTAKFGWLKNDDPTFFFDYCLQLDNKVPIRLGVYRSLREPREAWLGLPKYSELAGALWIPKEDARRLPVWFEASGTGTRVPSLPASLAEGVGRTDMDRPMWRKISMKQITGQC